MGKLKDKLYNYFVRKNGRIWYEYERYVREHLEEHHLHRFKHLKLLLKLNWFYRVKKRNTPYLYWDVPIEPNACLNQADIKKENIINRKSNVEKKIYPESIAYRRKEVEEFADELLKYDIISFDIFDTLIFRPFSSPRDIFNVLAIEMEYARFPEIRVEAEEKLREKHVEKNGEITIYEIYQWLYEMYGIEHRWGQREIELELEFCEPNPYMLEVYNILCSKSADIIAVSDMYLPYDKIKRMLEKCGFVELNEIYISCEMNCNKRGGDLQKRVATLKGKYKSYVHVGDNYANDIRDSKKIGWNTVYYEKNKIRGEKYRPQGDSSLTKSLYMGIVNNRLHASNEKLSPQYEHGYVYGGILTCGYCEWLNELAKREKIDKFLFVSRDGNIINQVYNRFYGEVKTEYVYVSRNALYQADFEYFLPDYLNDMIYSRAHGTYKIKEVLKQTGLDMLTPLLKEYSLEENELLKETNYEVLKEIIIINKEKISEEWIEHKNAAKKYISSLVNPNEKACFVDVGWNGTGYRIFKHLADKVLQQNSNMIGALIGTCRRKEVQQLVSANKIFVYAFSYDKNLEWLRFYKPGVHSILIEYLFSAPLPSLISYCMDEDEVRFEFSEIDEVNRKYSQDIQKGILDFAEKYNQITCNYKNVFKITPVEAYLPLKDVLNDKEYSRVILGEYLEDGLAGVCSYQKNKLKDKI